MAGQPDLPGNGDAAQSPGGASALDLPKVPAGIRQQRVRPSGLWGGEQTPAAIGWLMLAVMVVPYDNWDNRYSLMGFVLMALLFLAGGMRSRALRLDLKSVGPYAVILPGQYVWPGRCPIPRRCPCASSFSI
ncbi:MAG: hypothetical protein ACLSAF_17800 [Intestinimonas sp.]